MRFISLAIPDLIESGKIELEDFDGLIAELFTVGKSRLPPPPSPLAV